MRTSFLGWIGLSLVAVIALAGCQAVPVSLSPSTIPLDQGGYTVVEPDVSGQAYGVYIFGIPLTEPDPIGRARDRALEGHDALVNLSANLVIINLLVLPVIIQISTVSGDAVAVN